MLNPKLTTAFETFMFTREINLFVSRLNKQFPQYCAYRPNPDAKYIDASSMSWSYVKFFFLFSSIQLYPKSSSKGNPGPSIRNFSHAQLANATLVSSVNATSDSTSGNSAPFNRSSQVQFISRNSSLSPQEAGTVYVSCIREKLSQQGLSQDAVTIVLASWRDGSKF